MEVIIRVYKGDSEKGFWGLISSIPELSVDQDIKHLIVDWFNSENKEQGFHKLVIENNEIVRSAW